MDVDGVVVVVPVVVLLLSKDKVDGWLAKSLVVLLIC